MKSEVKNIGPLFRSALPHHDMKVDPMGSSVSNIFATWRIDNEVPSFVNQFVLQGRDTILQVDKTLSRARKKLMCWHLELGVSMSHVQRLTKVTETHEPNGRVSVMNRVIVPKLKTATNCEIPLCQSCNFSRAKQRKAEVVKSKAIKLNVGAISQDKDVPGDFVSLDQYVTKEPGCLPTGFDREAKHNMCRGGTFFVIPVLNALLLRTRYLWEMEEHFQLKKNLKLGCGIL